MIVRPGRPFWSGFTAFFTSMIGMFGVDQVDVVAEPIVINNWWVATLLSLLVGAAVYGQSKVSELRGTHPPAEGMQT